MGVDSVNIANVSFSQGTITAMGLETQLRKRLARSQPDAVQRSQETGSAAAWTQQGLNMAALAESMHIHAGKHAHICPLFSRQNALPRMTHVQSLWPCGCRWCWRFGRGGWASCCIRS